MKYDEDREQAEKVLKFMEGCSLDYHEDFITIGGWALHAYDAKEFSLDGDAMVTRDVFAHLRETFSVVPNPLLNNHQLQAPDGFQVDINVEDEHGMRVPFQEIQRWVQLRKGLYLPCRDHLLILKLEAVRARGHTTKGQSDRLDVVRLVYRGACEHQYLSPRIFGDYLTDSDLEEIKYMATDPEIIRSIGPLDPDETLKPQDRIAQYIEVIKESRFQD